MATKIVVDAGHGGYDNGASYLDRRKKEDNLRLALAVGAILEENGYEANIFTRGEYYAVQVGNYEDLQNASNIAKTLRSQGFETLIVTSWE